MRPFLELLKTYPDFPPALLDSLAAVDADERVPIAAAHELLAGAVALTKDPDIGLKAARHFSPGDYGLLEYMISSAPTWGDAINLLGRYLPLINDALHYSLRIERGQAIVQLDSSVPMPRAAADFQSAAFHITAAYQAPSPRRGELVALFTHPRPDSIDEYERTFVGRRVVFDAPFNGFSFEQEFLSARMQTANPKLHQVLRAHAELVLAELPRTESLTQKVRDLVAQQLATGGPSAEAVARELHMSRRTFSRKLLGEGTNFTELLDDMRRRSALRYVGDRELGLSEIAFLLGFSQTGAFHRAFKRWTGQTPLEYRRERRK